MGERLRRRQVFGICVSAHSADAKLYIDEKRKKRRKIWVREWLRERERLPAHITKFRKPISPEEQLTLTLRSRLPVNRTIA